MSTCAGKKLRVSKNLCKTSFMPSGSTGEVSPTRSRSGGSWERKMAGSSWSRQYSATSELQSTIISVTNLLEGDDLSSTLTAISPVSETATTISDCSILMAPAASRRALRVSPARWICARADAQGPP